MIYYFSATGNSKHVAEPQIDSVIAMIRQRVQGNKSKDRMPYFGSPA